jgi:hypothetical protein
MKIMNNREIMKNVSKIIWKWRKKEKKEILAETRQCYEGEENEGENMKCRRNEI